MFVKINADDLRDNCADYYVNGRKIASTSSQLCKDLTRITLYENQQPRYKLIEHSRMEWILFNWAYPLSFFLPFFLNPVYDIYDGTKKVGASLERWLKPIHNFSIRNDIYRDHLHKNETFSLHKNGQQIALYIKDPCTFYSTTEQQRSYSIWYDESVPTWIIYMFCIFYDWLFFSCHPGTKKIMVYNDSHIEYTKWRPIQ